MVEIGIECVADSVVVVGKAQPSVDAVKGGNIRAYGYLAAIASILIHVSKRSWSNHRGRKRQEARPIEQRNGPVCTLLPCKQYS